MAGLSEAIGPRESVELLLTVVFPLFTWSIFEFFLCHLQKQLSIVCVFDFKIVVQREGERKNHRISELEK